MYYDADAPMKATESPNLALRQKDGSQPASIRPLQPITGADKKLDFRKRMNIDSDQALKTAIAEPLLDKHQAHGRANLWLQHGDDGYPTWKVRFWARRR